MDFEFDPNETVAASNGSDIDVQTGDYLQKIVYFSRNTSATGNEYLRLKVEVISGEFAGGAYYTNLSCKVGSFFFSSFFLVITASLKAHDAPNKAMISPVHSPSS